MNRSALLALLAGIVAACSETEPTQSCAGPEDCPADARCQQEVCVGNRPPVAALEAPASPVVYELVALSGAASADPDPDDAVSTYRWAVRAAGAPCDPPVVAGTTSTAQVRFGCTGRYEVELVVEDALGLASAPATSVVDVVAGSSPSPVSAGGDVSVGHACAGVPLRCRPGDGSPVALSATGPSGAGISYRWIVQPPQGRALGVGRRVTFSPGADVTNPTVAIETDGLAISGDWILRVEAVDAYGVLGAAATRLSVTNRAPVVTGTIDPVPHVYAAVAQRFEASGTIHVEVADPDGDPLERAVAVHHVNAGAASTFTANDVGDAVTFAIVVPYTSSAAAGHLIGGAGLARDVELTVTDANGESAKGHWDVVVQNRPPERVSGVTPLPVDHVYVAAESAYVATADLSTWSDPDGDPLLVSSQPPAPCDALTISAGKVSVRCAQAFTGVPAANTFAGQRTIVQDIHDPWATESFTTQLQIHNRPPLVTTYGFTAVGLCTSKPVCCDYDVDLHECLAWQQDWRDGSVGSGEWIQDPDGDPLVVTFDASTGVGVSPASRLCLPGDCQFTFAPVAVSGCTLGSASRTVNLSDGGAAVERTLSVTRTCASEI